MKAYLRKGGTAVLDQVLFSGSNFLLNLFLVKLLTPADYGVFGSLYSLYLLTVIIFGPFYWSLTYFTRTNPPVLGYTPRFMRALPTGCCWLRWG